MKSRQIIEARLGRKLPSARDMRPDDRQAVKRLAVQLLRQRVQQTGDNP